MELIEGPMDPVYEREVVEALIASHGLLSAAQHYVTLCPRAKYTLKMSWVSGLTLDSYIPYFAKGIARILAESDTRNRLHVDQLYKMDGWVTQLFEADKAEQVVFNDLGQWDFESEAAQDLMFHLRPHMFRLDGEWLELHLVLCAQLR